jgi:hypothetical protein
METDVLKTVGEIAGIGGIALGVFLLLFRDIIRRSIFPRLTKEQGFRLLRFVAVLVWSVALVGVGVWVWVETNGPGSSSAAVGAGRDLKARDITVSSPSETESKTGGVEAGRDITARDITVDSK